ncbi:MAG: aldehyde ferredoxin oxidoreductase C-terminal domain-containing protein [Planctomycetota bacterium]|jgi:aldehyde:ferredoxin oxidoreductase
MSKQVADFTIARFHIDLGSGAIAPENVACEDLDDVLGGIARAFKLLLDRGVDDAYAPEAALVLNLGALSGTDVMTGLRTFFSGYSPLKMADNGKPGSMWSAGSGKFGTKLRHLGVEEVVLTGRASEPVLLHITEGPTFELKPAADLVGLRANAKIQMLKKRHPDAHFAVIGPAGENYESVRYAAIALSTENQLKSGDNKPRFCGRGGFGGVLGSKNLLAIVADIPDPKHGKAAPELVELNKEIARGKGSQRFRDARKGNGGGGTWANYESLNPVHCVPENNFVPTGTEMSFALHRPMVEQGPYVVKDESCYRCGIACHKNIYDRNEDGKAGQFRAKFDYEPLNLLSSNLGIFDPDAAADLVELVDDLCMDSISLGASISYAMEHNRRHPDAPIADGVTFGDVAATTALIEKIGAGKMPLVGQGAKRAGTETGEPGYAMHCKGVEFPAYLPHTNPGYPWALAGGHMSMATYLLLLYEKETGLDYWVDAITRRGIGTLRDDILGVCKFAGLNNANAAAALAAATGLELQKADLIGAVQRVFLRGYRMEKSQGFQDADYDMPSDVHEQLPQVELPYFNTAEFFAELKAKVNATFDAQLEAHGV